MKKALLLFTLFITLFTYSQNSKIKFGIQAALNYSNFRGYTIPADFEPFYSESPAFGYLGGVNIEYKIKDRLSLKVELNYERKSQKGDNTAEFRENFDDPSVVYNFTTQKNYDYLVLPILLKYTFTADTSFYLNGGPFIGYLLKSEVTNDLNIPNVNTEDMETTDLNKKMDFGLSVGLGKTFDVSKNKSMSIEIREI